MLYALIKLQRPAAAVVVCWGKLECGGRRRPWRRRWIRRSDSSRRHRSAFSQSVTIGATGTAGTVAPPLRGHRGHTSVGALLSATGGTGGAASTAAAAATGVSFCRSRHWPASVQNGDINETGGGGTRGAQLATNQNLPGNGGNSVLGGGALGLASAGTGLSAGNYGGGASGGLTTVTNINQNGGLAVPASLTSSSSVVSKTFNQP